MFELWHLWIIAGILLWILEIFSTYFVLCIFGTSCIVTALFAGLGFSLKVQLLIFCMVTAVMTLCIRPLILNYLYCRGSMSNTNVDALIGQAGIVTETIDHISGTGSVKIGGEIWRAISENESRVEIGQPVSIRKIAGCTAIVEIIPKI